MSKERLEEIEVKYSTLTVSSERDGIEYTEVDVKDLVFLIQNGFKQAERVQELEQKNDRLKQEADFWRVEDREMMRLSHENKRYREALNSIMTLWKYSEDRTDFEWLAHKMSDEARKALEGEE